MNDELTGREFDAEVADRVHEWIPLVTTDGCTVPPHFHSDPAADYSTLELVQRTWTREGKGRFEDALHAIIIRRRDPTVSNPNNYGSSIGDILDYRVGDYSRAALDSLPPRTS